MMYVRSMILVVVADILVASSAAPLVHNTEDHLSKRLEKLEKRVKALDEMEIHDEGKDNGTMGATAPETEMEKHDEENMGGGMMGATDPEPESSSGDEMKEHGEKNMGDGQLGAIRKAFGQFEMDKHGEKNIRGGWAGKKAPVPTLKMWPIKQPQATDR